jgi:biotin carboxylase
VSYFLVLGGGPDQLFMVRTLRQMGLRSLVVDQNPGAVASSEADLFVCVSNRDLKGLTSFVESFLEAGNEILGVSTMGSDIPMSLAHLSALLGKPGLSRKSAEVLSDKALMKKVLRSAGISTPAFSVVASASQAEEVWNSWSQPVVIKPPDQAGSRGVKLARTVQEVREAFYEAKLFSKSQSVLMEQYVPGPQLSTESLVYQGEVFTAGFADRNYADTSKFLPQILENGGWVPSVFQSYRAEVDELISKAAKALEISTGVIKGDLVLSQDGVQIIEVAGRLSGGDFSESLVPIGSGVNYVREVIGLAMGNELTKENLVPTREMHVANRYFFLEPGTLESINNLEALREKSWLPKLDIWSKVGDELGRVDSHGSRAGVFVVTGDSRHTVEDRINLVYRTISFTINGSVHSGDPR